MDISPTAAENFGTPLSDNDLNQLSTIHVGGSPGSFDLGWNRVYQLALRVRFGIFALGVLANLLVLAVQMKLMTFRKTQFLFAFSLTIIDMLSPVFIFYEAYIYAFGSTMPPVWCRVMIAGLFLMSYFAILGVAVDRYMAVCAFPLRYKLLVSTSKYTVAIALTSLFCFGSSSFIYITFDHQYAILGAISAAAFVVFTTMIPLVYFRLSFSVWKSLAGLNLPETIKKRRTAQTKRLLFAFTTILLTALICMLPLPIFGLYILCQPPGQRFELIGNIAIGTCLYNLQTCSHFVNPIIYWRRAVGKEIGFKSAFRRSLRPNASKTRTEVASTTLNQARHSTESVTTVSTCM